MAASDRKVFSESVERELGIISPVAFTRGASEGLLNQLKSHDKYVVDRCCVSLDFNSSDLLLCAEQKRIRILKWTDGNEILRRRSLHLVGDRIVDARLIAPTSSDVKILTCSECGEVNLGELEGVEVRNIRSEEHRGVCKLAVDPVSPDIAYSAGRDGAVQQFDLRSHSATRRIGYYSVDRPRTRVTLSALAINPLNSSHLAVGCSDDPYVRIYDVRRSRVLSSFCPDELKGETCGLIGLAFSNTGELLASYDSRVYLFKENMGLAPKLYTPLNQDHQIMGQVQHYLGHRTALQGASFFGPDHEHVVSGSEGGKVLMWRKIGGSCVRLLSGAASKTARVQPHPWMPVLGTWGASNFSETVAKVWSHRPQEENF